MKPTLKLQYTVNVNARFGEDVQRDGEKKKSVETVAATINNVLQSNFRAISWVEDTDVALEVQKACELTFSEAWI